MASNAAMWIREISQQVLWPEYIFNQGAEQKGPPPKALLIKRGVNNVGSFSICVVPDSAQAQTEEKTGYNWEKKKRWGGLIDKVKFRGAGAKVMLFKKSHLIPFKISRFLFNPSLYLEC